MYRNHCIHFVIYGLWQGIPFHSCHIYGTQRGNEFGGGLKIIIWEDHFYGGSWPRHREMHTINYMLLKSVKYMGAEYFSELEGKEGHIHGCKDNRFARNGFHQCFTIYPNWRKIYHQSSQKILKKLIRKICKILQRNKFCL